MRVELNPTVLNKYGIGLEDVRAALAAANANRPKGQLADATPRSGSISTTDQLFKADEYRPLIVAYRNGAAVRLSDVATVDRLGRGRPHAGWPTASPRSWSSSSASPGANIIDTVDRVHALLPQLQASIPPAIKLSVVMDRTTDHPRLGARRRAHAADLDRAW